MTDTDQLTTLSGLFAEASVIFSRIAHTLADAAVDAEPAPEPGQVTPSSLTANAYGPAGERTVHGLTPRPVSR